MIKKYLEKIYYINEAELENLENQMNDLIAELNYIEECKDTPDIDVSEHNNIFSPRVFNTENNNISLFKKKKTSVNQEIEKIRVLLEIHLKKREEYKALLDEFEILENEKKETDELVEIKKTTMKFMDDIYRNIELCMALLNSDKHKCKMEMGNIKKKIKKYSEVMGEEK